MRTDNPERDEDRRRDRAATDPVGAPDDPDHERKGDQLPVSDRYVAAGLSIRWPDEQQNAERDEYRADDDQESVRSREDFDADHRGNRRRVLSRPRAVG